MNVQVKAVHALSHDALRLARGEVGEVSEVTAAELASRGLVTLVEEKQAPAHANKMQPLAANKAAKSAPTTYTKGKR